MISHNQAIGSTRIIYGSYKTMLECSATLLATISCRVCCCVAVAVHVRLAIRHWPHVLYRTVYD